MSLPDEKFVSRLLDVMEQDIIPLTRQGVDAGNKVFGAAVLRKSDLSLVLAETNNETENPIWHGETHLIKKFFELDALNRPDTKDLIFLSTHEPCTMCMSAITWAGFDNYYYFFCHEDSKDQFDIPHDLKIMKALYGLDAGQYNKHNAFFDAHDIIALANNIDNSAPLEAQIDRITQAYQDMSLTYQSGKSDNDIPLN